jgi:uncharacterized RDD family membrane protein YckC
MEQRSALRSCHEILGVPRDAAPDEIATAYLRSAMRAHPCVPRDDAGQARAAQAFAQAAEAWAVLSHAAAIRGTGEGRDAHALATFDEALDRHALSLAVERRDAQAVLVELVGAGCPQAVAWPAAERAVRLAALGVRPRPAPGDPPAAALPAAAPQRATPRAPRREAPDLDAPPDEPARVSERIAAAVADALVLLALCAAPVLVLGRLADLSAIAVDRLAVAALLVGAAAFYVRAESGRGGTPGDRLLGLTVCRLDGGPIDRRLAMIRHALRALSLCVGGAGFLTVLVTDRRQAVHDLLTGTCMTRSGTADRPALVRALCAAPAVALAGAAILSFG